MYFTVGTIYLRFTAHTSSASPSHNLHTTRRPTSPGSDRLRQRNCARAYVILGSTPNAREREEKGLFKQAVRPIITSPHDDLYYTTWQLMRLTYTTNLVTQTSSPPTFEFIFLRSLISLLAWWRGLETPIRRRDTSIQLTRITTDMGISTLMRHVSAVWLPGCIAGHAT